jgi:hypothetical protein
MSYDLYIFRAPGGTPPHELGDLALALTEAGMPTSEPSPEVETAKHALADALRASNPALEPFAFDHAELARGQGITEAEARRRYRHIELTDPELVTGVQITLYDDWASVTLPYWHSGAAARAVWSEVWRYLHIFVEKGHVVYDPQLDRPLNLDVDEAEVQRMYGSVADDITSIATSAASKPQRTETPSRKQWWKFW